MNKEVIEGNKRGDCYSIWDAVAELIESESFKETAKKKNSEGSKYRMFIARYNNLSLRYGGAVEFLINHGYSIKIIKPTNQTP